MMDTAWRVIEWVAGIFLATMLAILAWYETTWRGRVDSDLREIREELDVYKSNVGAGNAMVERLSEQIGSHVHREETILWEEIRADRAANQASHEKLIGVLDNMSTRMTTVEVILNERLPEKAKPAKPKARR